MLMRIVTWILTACVVIAGITWIGKDNNGKELGTTGGNAVNGTFEGIQAFIDNAFD